MGLPLAYHRDDEIDRVVAMGEIAVGLVLLVIGIALMRRLEDAPVGGPNRLARFAALVVGIGIAAYALGRALPDGDELSGALLALAAALLLIVFVVGLVGPILATFALDRVRSDGEGRLAVVTFVASLALPGIFVANVVACYVTDACFH